MSDDTIKQLTSASETKGALKENIRIINILLKHMNRLKEDINAMRRVESADELLIKLFHEIK